MIGFILGILASNASEWVIHKYVLHGMGRKKGTFWAFHFHQHHKNVRKSGGYDHMYEGPFWGSPAKSKEALSIAALGLALIPVAPIAPSFVAGVWANSAAYYYFHRKSHLDTVWARRWLPWHVDHHLGPNQDANYCVTWPLWDYVMGTRKPWVGTAAESQPARPDRQSLRHRSTTAQAER